MVEEAQPEKGRGRKAHKASRRQTRQEQGERPPSKNPKSGLDHARNKDSLGFRIARRGKKPKIRSVRNLHP
ncbi:MAG TPA: hypothetical protein VLB73_05105 [Patescibacteria group bacterium]|nr:hypothetical protein [Patescibacteria group bacterium]